MRNHLFSSLSPSHSAPPFWDRTITSRCLVWFPAPQVIEHSSQLSHNPQLHLIGHAGEVQTDCSESSPRHGSPSHSLGVEINLFLVIKPDPHVVEHKPQLPHVPHWQLMGQQPVEHLRVSVVDPEHAFPPQLFIILYPRVLVEIPPPQDCEHEPQLPHAPHWQLTGQHWLLHDLIPGKLHAGPQDPLCLVIRGLWAPPPHEREQDLHTQVQADESHLLLRLRLKKMN